MGLSGAIDVTQNRLMPWVLAVAVFMDQMDSAALATVLPVIARDLGIAPMLLKLALTSYLVSLAVFIPICGWLALRFGARRVFRISLLLFTAGSLAAALSASLESLILARILQGAGAAAMVPVARILIVRSVPREQLVQALAWWTMPAMLAPITGPMIGGALATWASWQWIFLINLPFGLIGWLLAGRYVPETETVPDLPLDLPGFLLSAICFSGLITGISLLGIDQVSPQIALSLLLPAGVAALLYGWRFPRVPAPLLDLRLFRDGWFRASMLAGLLYRIGTGAVHFLMPMLLQFGFGLSALQSGLLTCAGAFGALTSKMLTARLFARYGFVAVLLPVGLVTGVLQALAAWFEPGMNQLWIIAYMAIGGLLRATFFAGVSAMGYQTVPDTQAGDVSILASVNSQIAIGIGISIAGSLLALTGGAAIEPGLPALRETILILGAGSAIACLPLLIAPRR